MSSEYFPEIAELDNAVLEDRANGAMALLVAEGQKTGPGNKEWVIDQTLRSLLGDEETYATVIDRAFPEGTSFEVLPGVNYYNWSEGTKPVDAEQPSTQARFVRSINPPIAERIGDAVVMLIEQGSLDGDHHKEWTIDQTLSLLAGAEGTVFPQKNQDGSPYPHWTGGIAP